MFKNLNDFYGGYLPKPLPPDDFIKDYSVEALIETNLAIAIKVSQKLNLDAADGFYWLVNFVNQFYEKPITCSALSRLLYQCIYTRLIDEFYRKPKVVEEDLNVTGKQPSILVHDCISCLQKKDQRVLNLMYEGWTVHEILSKLNIGPHSYYSTIERFKGKWNE